MKIGIQIDDKDIVKIIKENYYSKLRPKWVLACNQVLPGIKRICYDSIVSSPEYGAAVPGSRLYHELGVPDIQQRLQRVIQEVIDNIYVKNKMELAQDGTISANFEIGVLKSDFSDLLSLPEATYDYHSTKQAKDIILPWLEWLLLDGSQPIVLGYHFAPVVKPQSRTGLGLMFNHGNWNIDSSYAGTIRNNFLTRSIRGIQDELQQFIEDEFSKDLNTP